jgi:type 1 glutamine amidotransferase
MNVLLFGGGGVHDYAGICPVLADYLRAEPSFDVDYVIEEYDAFSRPRITAYHLVVLYHTGGTLTPEQSHDLTQHVASGCGFFGVHGAADSFRTSRDYIAMLGGELSGHPCMREFLVSLNDPVPGIVSHIRHPVTRDIKGYTVADWEQWPVFEYLVTDEQYLLDYDPRVDVIASALFKGKSYPVAWTKSWGNGRVMYTHLGHHMPAIEATIFQDLFVNGCRWAAGLTQDEPAEGDA